MKKWKIPVCAKYKDYDVSYKIIIYIPFHGDLSTLSSLFATQITFEYLILRPRCEVSILQRITEDLIFHVANFFLKRFRGDD